MGIFGFFSSRPMYEEVQPSNNAPSTPEPSNNFERPSFNEASLPSTRPELEKAMWNEVRCIKNLRSWISWHALGNYCNKGDREANVANRAEIKERQGHITAYLEKWKGLRDYSVSGNPSTKEELVAAISEENSHIASLKKKVSNNAYELREGCSQTNEEMQIWREQNASYRAEIKECEERIAKYKAKLK